MLFKELKPLVMTGHSIVKSKLSKWPRYDNLLRSLGGTFWGVIMGRKPSLLIRCAFGLLIDKLIMRRGFLVTAILVLLLAGVLTE